MQALSSALLAAQRAWGAEPCVRIRLEDRELRWWPLLDDDGSTCPTAACASLGGIVRARLSAAGTLDVQRITSPSVTAEWQAWTPLLSGVAEGSDLALSSVEGDPGRLRLFFCRGSGLYQLSWLQSVDGGVTWSAPADYLSGLPSAGMSLASANGGLLYHDPTDHYLKLALPNGWDSGTWTVRTWLGGGALAVRHGLSVASSGSLYRIATCDQESVDVCRLRVGTYDSATDVWTEPLPIVPPGLPAAAFAPKYPSLVQAGGLWHLSYLETLSGLVTCADPIVIHSPDWEHWSFACWVPLVGYGPERRPALVFYEGAFYLCLEKAVWWAQAFDPSDGDRALITEEVLGYVVEEQPWDGSALIELYNPDDRYRGFGQAGQAGAAARPLARLIIERGYRTAAGEERVARSPYYLINAAIRRGGPRPALCLEAEDGWGLLRRWRPDALYAWSGKTIAWLVAELVYRAAGLPCFFDSADGWDTVLDSFAVAPANWDGALTDQRRAWLARDYRAREGRPGAETVSGTALGALRVLLAKVSACACWQSDGSLYCFVPTAQTLRDPYAIGAAGEIEAALYGRGLLIPSEARVFGDGAAGVAASPAALGSPRRYIATYVDPHADTADECLNRARGLIYDGQAHAYVGWVETPCQCGLELYDLVTVEDPHASVTPAEFLRIVGIVERYDPAQGVFTTRATFEGV